MSFKWFGDKIASDLEQSVKTGVAKGIADYEEVVWDMISNRPKSGKVYVRTTRKANLGNDGGTFTLGGAKRVHKASAPGQPFAYDFGEWWGSRMTRQTGLTAEFSVATDYAARLEFDPSFARPTLRPALVEAEPQIKADITDAVKKVIK